MSGAPWLKAIVVTAAVTYLVALVVGGFPSSVGVLIGNALGVVMLVGIAYGIAYGVHWLGVKVGLLADDTRGLGVGIFAFLAIIIIVALMYILVDPAADKTHSIVSTQLTHSEARTASNRRHDIITLFPMYGLFLGGLFILARSVRESRRGP